MMMTPLTWLILGEWGLTAVGSVVFLLLYGWPGRYQDRVMAWHIVSVTAVTAVETLGLLAATLRIGLPLWLFAVIYGAAGGVVFWRLWLLLKTRRRLPAAE